MRIDEIFKALADANRRKILDLLKEHDTLTAGEIAEKFTISKPAISDHLKVLRNADLVYSIKRGQFIYYQLNTTVMQEITKNILELFSNQGRRQS